MSGHVGRFWPNVLGMCICGAGVAMVVMGTGPLWWSGSAGGSWFRHGAALPEPLGRGRGHHPARLAQLGDCHLSVLA